MPRLILNRLLQMVPVVFGVTIAAFILVNILPGNVINSILGNNYTPQTAAILSKQLHLNQPLFQRYFTWVGGLLHGNLGTSLISHQSVARAIWNAMPPTIELMIFAQVVAITVGVGLAVAAVYSKRAWVDRLVTAIVRYGVSVPAFVTGFVLLLIFSVHWHLVSSLGWHPISDGIGKNLSAMIVPAITLALTVFPGYMRILRREMFEQLEREEYVVLARMKGVTAPGLIFRHVVRNSSLGIVTLIGLSTGQLLGGAVVIESIFTIPGLGGLLVSAIMGRDTTMTEGCIVVFACVVIIINLFVDIAYYVIDPRTKARA